MMLVSSEVKFTSKRVVLIYVFLNTATAILYLWAFQDSNWAASLRSTRRLWTDIHVITISEENCVLRNWVVRYSISEDMLKNNSINTFWQPNDVYCRYARRKTCLGSEPTFQKLFEKLHFHFLFGFAEDHGTRILASQGYKTWSQSCT